MALKQSGDKSRYVIVAALLLLLTGLFYQFIYGPQRLALESKRQQLALLQRQLAGLNSFLAQHGDLALYESKLQGHDGWSQQLLPAELDTSEFIGSLQRHVLRTRVKLVGLRPEPPVNKDGFFRQKIEVAVEGDYFQLLDFIKLLEQGPRFVMIENIAGQVKEQGIFSGRMALYIFARSSAGAFGEE